MLEEESSISVTDILSMGVAATLRYWKLAMAPAFTVLFLVVVLVTRIPNYYESDSLIYMQPQRISSEVIRSPGQNEMNEQLQAVAQDILSRTRLSSIVTQFNLYPELLSRGTVGKERAIAKLRSKIVIEPQESISGAKLMQTFRLSFSDENNDTAYKVTKTITNLFIEESLISTQAEVLGTKEFLDSQLRDARFILEQTEDKVQKFIRENFGRLPEYLDQAVARLQNSQQQLQSNMQLIQSNIQARDNFRREMDLLRQAGGSFDASQSRPMSGDPKQNLQQLKKALQYLESKYSSKHPDVVNTKQRIATLEAQIRSGTAPRGDAATGAGVVSRDTIDLQRQIGTLDIEIGRLNSENESLKKSISELEKNIEQMPLVEQQLIKIKRDYASVKANYERLLEASKDAEIQNRLVQSQKGAQFRVVEAPFRPELPAGPNRVLYYGLGLLLSLFVYLAFPILLLVINPSYKFRDEVEREIGIPVLGVVPGMESPQSIRRRYLMFFSSWVIALVVCVGGSVAILMFV